MTVGFGPPARRWGSQSEMRSKITSRVPGFVV